MVQLWSSSNDFFESFGPQQGTKPGRKRSVDSITSQSLVVFSSGFSQVFYPLFFLSCIVISLFSVFLSSPAGQYGVVFQSAEQCPRFHANSFLGSCFLPVFEWNITRPLLQKVTSWSLPKYPEKISTTLDCTLSAVIEDSELFNLWSFFCF